MAMIDSGADVNYIQKGLISTKYYEKTIETIVKAENNKMTINYKTSKAKICKENIYFSTTFFLAKRISQQ
ncbi:hypothetical protein HN51_032180, partial [Arachis hypogaea]